MPLDPFFAERLRVHRRYLFEQALSHGRARASSALWPFGARVPASPRGGPARRRRRDARPSSRGRPRPTRGAGTRPAPASGARVGPHRAETVGTPGPTSAPPSTASTCAGHPAVRVRIYYPEQPSDAGAVPACLAFFGGAFRIGGIDYPTTDAAYRRRAADSGVAIVAVDYALAPEHRYPAQVEQAHAALEWLFDHAGELGIDAERIGVAGHVGRRRTSPPRSRSSTATGPGCPLRLQVLEVPVVDLTGRHLDLRATRALGIPSVIALRELRSVARTYLPRPAEAREPYASPLLAASHEGLPPAVILTAEYDPLRGDGDAYAAALRRAGVDASAVQYLGVTHDTPIFTAVLAGRPALARRRRHRPAAPARLTTACTSTAPGLRIPAPDPGRTPLDRLEPPRTPGARSATWRLSAGIAASV